mgnify:CR=1 FL=1
MLAHAAGHVVAALVLLDTSVAGGALARVGQDPVGRLRLVHALQSPLRQLRAGRGVVRLLACEVRKREDGGER